MSDETLLTHAARLECLLPVFARRCDEDKRVAGLRVLNDRARR